MFIAVCVYTSRILLHCLEKENHNKFLMAVKSYCNSDYCIAFSYLRVLLSFLDCMLIQFMQFPGVKLGEFRNKYPQVSVKANKKHHLYI